MKYSSLIENEYKVFLGFLKAKFPVFHNSNFFFRDLQYGAMKFLEKKGMKLSIQQSEVLAEAVSKFLEDKGIFVKINNRSWRINYPEFVTTAPGDPL